MNNSITLEAVTTEFKHWRETRSKQGKIPEALWDKVIQLLEHHSIAELTRVLRLSHEQIRTKLSCHQSPKSSAFVELEPLTLKEENNNINLGSKVELKRADGASMIIEHLTESHLANLLNVFMRGE